jgi:hypothetical protein
MSSLSADEIGGRTPDAAVEVLPGAASRRHVAWAAPVVLAVALALRLALLPLTAGNDFRSFEKLALLALQGRDVYGVSSAYLAAHFHSLSWTYFPLCLDMFAGLRWLGLHTGWPFQVLGKLPLVAADLGIGWLLYVALRRRGHSTRRAVVGMSLYLFNPLALYNGALYGRFDAVALVFLLLALEYRGTGAFAPAYALAIAAKTFPIFALPLLALGRARQAPARLALALFLTVLLALPYVAADPGGLFAYVIANNTHAVDYQRLGRLSWYSILYATHLLSMRQIMALARMVILAYPLLLLTLLRKPLYTKVAVCLVLFVLLNRTVYEQYLLWPLPFLIVMGLHERSRSALWIAALYTVAGMLENEYTWNHTYVLHYALVPTPWLPLNAFLAAATALFVGAQIVRRSRLSESPG